VLKVWARHCQFDPMIPETFLARLENATSIIEMEQEIEDSTFLNKL
jgi:hypothetical protein